MDLAPGSLGDRRQLRDQEFLNDIDFVEQSLQQIWALDVLCGEEPQKLMEIRYPEAALTPLRGRQQALDILRVSAYCAHSSVRPPRVPKAGPNPGTRRRNVRDGLREPVRTHLDCSR